MCVLWLDVVAINLGVIMIDKLKQQLKQFLDQPAVQNLKPGKIQTYKYRSDNYTEWICLRKITRFTVMKLRECECNLTIYFMDGSSKSYSMTTEELTEHFLPLFE